MKQILENIKYNLIRIFGPEHLDPDDPDLTNADRNEYNIPVDTRKTPAKSRSSVSSVHPNGSEASSDPSNTSSTRHAGSGSQ